MTRTWKFFAIACLVVASATSLAHADDPKPDTGGAQPGVTPYVKIGGLVFFRAYEDAFSRARKEGKLVMVYRMLGELDGLT